MILYYFFKWPVQCKNFSGYPSWMAKQTKPVINLYHLMCPISEKSVNSDQLEIRIIARINFLSCFQVIEVEFVGFGNCPW